MMPTRDRGDIVLPGSPMESLARELGGQISGVGHDDILLGSGEHGYRIRPEGFVAIVPTDAPKRIAVVDGGNGRLEETASFSVMINRTYFSLFKGKRRERPRTRSRIEFFSTTVVSIPKGEAKDRIKYSIRLYPQKPEDAEYLPDAADLHQDRSYPGFHELTQVDSMARKFAEWRMAAHVARAELTGGDILIMDGSLQTGFKREKRYADVLYDEAVEKGVTVCGLSKTSMMLTESGESLLARVEEISKEAGHGMWYVKVADRASPDGRVMVLVAKFHPRSEFVFRIEMLRDQFQDMDAGKINDILSSIAANAEDISMLGYPYAAIDADRFAQVRNNELEMYKSMLRSETVNVPELDWERIYRYRNALAAHERLNEVTS